MADLNNQVAGSKLFIGSKVTDIKDEFKLADFTGTGVTWVEIDGLSTLGSFGETQEVNTQSLINRRRSVKSKGQRSGGSMANIFVPIAADAGQIAFKNAADDNCANYMFKLEAGNVCDTKTVAGKTHYFVGLAMTGETQAGDASANFLKTLTIEINSNIVTA